MSKAKKKKADSRTVEKAPGSKSIDSYQESRRTGFIIASLVIAVILIVVGVFYYQEYVAPFRRIIITVDNTSMDMGYFLKRCRLTDADPMAMLQSLTNEQVIKLEAPRYVGEVSPEDINQELKNIASGGSGNITESELKEWYRQQLNESTLSDVEYKEMISASILANRLQAYLAERVPTVGKQVHLNLIEVETNKEAEKVRARWEAGENFADLAREASLDEQSKEKGGDAGWAAVDALASGLGYLVSNLAVGEVSQPFQPDPENEGLFYLVMVSEKSDARELDEQSLEVLKGKALQDWLVQEMQYHDINYNFNSEIYAWLNWQLSKSTQSTTTSSAQGG